MNFNFSLSLPGDAAQDQRMEVLGEQMLSLIFRNGGI